MQRNVTPQEAIKQPIRVDRFLFVSRPDEASSLYERQLADQHAAFPLTAVQPTENFHIGRHGNGEDHTKDIELLIEVILAHYETTQYDEQLLELQEVFYTPTGIPLGSQSRIAGRLIVGNRSGTQTLDADEMAKVLFASNRIDGVPLEEMSEAVRGLVNSHPIAVWHRLLPRFYFDDSSSNDVKRGCVTFLRLCFDEKNPALLLVFDNKIDGNNTWLARVVDIEGTDTPSREQLWERVRKQGLPCPEIDQADGEDEFFEKHAEARSNSKTWISQYLKVVIIFPAPRGAK